MSEINPGDVLLGKYRVERVLGQGGMGIVVAARHIELDEQVAIKLLLPELSRQGELVHRFLREARAAVKIRSEHIARVSDVGTLPSGAPYMVMEYLEGADLSAVVQSAGPLSVADAVDAVVHACDALAVAHSLSIVHRDIKPANLFRTTRHDGSTCVKVLDFGISKVTAPGTEQALTRTQGLMGSPLYMSPEQLTSAKDVDARADIYALGAVLYELLTGHTPYIAEDLPRLIVKILNEPVPLIRAERSDVPPALDDIVRRCLAKRREERIGTVGELCALLAPFASPQNRVIAERVMRSTSPSLPQTNPHAVTPAELATSAPSFTATHVEPPVRPFPVFAVVVVFLALVAGGVFLAIRGRASGSNEVKTAASAGSTSNAHIDVRVAPPSAWLQLDDGEKVLGRLTRDVTLDGREHVLRAGGEGYVTQAVPVTESTTRTITLTPTPVAGTTIASGGPVASAFNTPAAATKPAAPGKPAPSTTAPLPKTTATAAAVGANGSKILE